MNKFEKYKDFYILFINNLKHRNCQNCNKYIPNVDLGNCAHILPKTIFESVSKNLNNMFLLCESCHSQYDSSWKNAQKMPCFTLAKERFILLEKYITEDHKILSYFKNDEENN